MLLTLNQVLFIILTIAAVVVATLLALFLIQLRRTAREGEKALAKAQELMEGMKVIEAKIDTSLDDLGHVLQTSKRTVLQLSRLAYFFSPRGLRPSAKYWPFIFPLIRFGWQQLKKRKEKHHGE
ncbi:MAG: hypothetical protein R6X21_00255 [Candidatus Aminicenantes bacterium]